MRHQSRQRRLTASFPSVFLIALCLFTFTISIAQEVRPRKFRVKPLPLPSASGLVMLDYFAYDPSSRLIWVPAANTGSVNVIDTTTAQIKRVEAVPVAITAT